jgi:diaminopimelate decarboxylase
MREFDYKDGMLFAENVAVRQLAETFGTPLYVYSRNSLRSRYQALARAMAPVQPLICYSVKANPCRAVVREFLEQGAGADVVSGGELYRALRAGADPARIVFAGVGKTREEIEFALKNDILFFTVESEPEAARISECARALDRTARMAFRVNPDVDPKTHQYITTGKKENKFGLDRERILQACAEAAKLSHVQVVGLHMHIGSQILDAEPFATALERVLELCVQLRTFCPHFRYLDLGGGIGIPYRADQKALDASAYAERLLPALRKADLSVVLEPGRCLVGPAGILVCRVQYVKKGAYKKFVIVDAGMNDLIRPSLYEAYQEIVAVRETDARMFGDLVGPICESGDFLAKDRDLPEVEQDDLLAVLDTGAYGHSMASNYNSRPRAAEIMVDGDHAFPIRHRETIEDIVRGEL